MSQQTSKVVDLFFFRSPDLEEDDHTLEVKGEAYAKAHILGISN